MNRKYIRNFIKLAKGKNNSSPRANTQEVTHRKNKNSTIGKNRIPPKEKEDDYLRKNSAININPIKNDTNIKLSLNSETANCISNNVSKANKTIRTEAQFLEIINNKNKEIKELERKIKKEKLSLMTYLKKGNCKNTNTSLNSFNLSKTRSSTNFTERNILQINSFCNSKMKIKTSYPLPGAKCKNDPNINKNKMRPKSDDYKKPKNNNFSKQQKNYVIYYNSQRAKIKNYTNNFVINYKRCNSSKQKNSTDKCNKINNNINIIAAKNNNNTFAKVKSLSIEETRGMLDYIYNRYKQVLEVVKTATIENDK